MARVGWVPDFGGEARGFDVPAVATLTGAVALCFPGGFDRPVVCVRFGVPVLRESWGSTPADGAVFIGLPGKSSGGGGGSNPTQAVMSIALMAAGAYFGPMAAEGILGSAYFNMGVKTFGVSLAGKILGGAIGGLVSIGGSSLMNAFMPSTRQSSLYGGIGTSSSMEAADTVYSLDRPTNTARLQAPIPCRYGRTKNYPDLAAESYWEYRGNEQYVYGLYCLGQGDYDIEELGYEDTAFWADGDYTGSFEEIELEFVPPGEEVTLFPDNVETSGEVAGQEMDGPNNLEEGDDGWIGPFTVNSAGTTCRRFGFDVVCSKGLYYANNSGGLDSRSMSYEFQIREIDDDGDPVGEWISQGVETYSAATNTPQRLSHDYEADHDGRWQARGRRTTDKDNTAQVGNDLLWAGMRAYLPEQRSYGNVFILAVVARGTNNLSNSSARRLYDVSTRKLPAWDADTQTWSDPAATSSIAWAAADACKAQYGGRLTDPYVDLDALAALDAVWAGRGDEFNFVSSTRDKWWSALKSILEAGRTKPLVVGGKVSFIRDAAQAVVKEAFTPRSIVRDSFSTEYVLCDEDTPDDVIVEFFNKATWKWDEVRCALPDSVSENPARVRPAGIDNRPQAWREGMWKAANNAWRRVFASFQSRTGGRFRRSGDLVSVSHPLPRWGQDGHLKAEGELLTLTLSIRPEWTDGQEHWLGLRRRDGSLWGPVRVASVDGYDLTIDEADFGLLLAGGGDDPFDPATGWLCFPSGKRQPTEFQFGPGNEWSRRCIVVNTKMRGEDLVELLVCVEHDEVHTADTEGTVPIAPTPPSLPVLPSAPVVAELYVEQSGTPAAPVFHAAWSPGAGASRYYVQYSVDNQNWTNVGTTDGVSLSFMVPPGPLSVRVAGMGRVLGPWRSWSGTASGAASMTLPSVTLSCAWTGQDAGLSWTASEGASSYDLELWAEGALRRSAAVSGTAFDYTEALRTADGGPWTAFTARARARGADALSAWAELVVEEPGD